MKHGKRLHKWMKELCKEKGLNPDNHLYTKNELGLLTVVNILTNNQEPIKYEVRK